MDDTEALTCADGLPADAGEPMRSGELMDTGELTDSGELMGIGAFARRVGLAPSALRFYDDCGVLRPAAVDETTGYRSYAPAQEARAVLVRRLRAAGMPLTDALAVLDGAREDARALLEEHARQARETADSARTAIEEILSDLRGGARPARARLGGAELASAVRQVAPAVAPAAAREEFPVLGRVLVEVGRQEVRLVATDRYRLAVRALRPSSTEGDPCRALTDVTELRAAASWAMRQPELTVEADHRGLRLRGGDITRELATAEETFPDYRTVLDNLPGARHRIIADRAALRAALTDAGHPGPVTLRAEGRTLTLDPVGAPGPLESREPRDSHDPLEPRGSRGSRGQGSASRGQGTSLPVLYMGEPVRLAFDPGVLVPALDASVGPDVLLEIAAPDQPVVVRSADQGSFTTLVMPVRDTAAEA